MLIVPLHRPLTRSNLPWVTVGILLLNLFVYFVLQAGDGRRHFAAMSYYLDSGLAEIEAPLYLQYQRARGELAPEASAPDSPALMLSGRMVNDRWFRQQLEAGALFASPEDRQRWQALDQVHRELRDRVFTDRHVMHAQVPTATAALVSMFLHGDLGHLLGNMVFLLLVGFLVEGVLGGWRHLLLYLASGVGAAFAYVAWAYGDPVGGLGASGAIAGLMGAVSVLWGLRKIRFFYWFFVIFDYVRAPAILLLPAWLGWELAQMLLDRGSPVAYSAHAGGMVAGALLAFAARGLGWTREEGFAEDVRPADPVVGAIGAAQALLGQARAAEAEARLAPLALAHPQRLDLALCRYRIARSARADAATLRARAEAVLGAEGSDPGSLREKWSVLRELGSELSRMPAAPRAALASALAGIGEAQAALSLMQGLAGAPLAGLPLQWLRLAHQLRESRQPALATQALHALVQHHPDSPEAGKARFLLEQSP
ncbi:MAG: rhomboid family intramembrane serine protease [Xanthomonadales bacterium]|jgi:membrane associated rhomboid family serine protease|nr:rhomboid family intramembrane serine protease [Xanthomonadales bacterium]